LKNDVNVASKSNKQKKLRKNKFFAGTLKVNDENSDPDPLVRGIDLRIRIHPKMSWIRNTTLNYKKIHGGKLCTRWWQGQCKAAIFLQRRCMIFFLIKKRKGPEKSQMPQTF
jgi:hypothetical protein